MPRRKRIEEDELTSADYAAADAVYQRNPLIKVYAHGTKTQLRQVRTWWDLHCQKQHKGDSDVYLQQASASAFRQYLRWSTRNSGIRKQSSIKQQWKWLRLCYSQVSGQKVDEKIGQDVLNFIEGPLTLEHNLDTEPSLKPTLSIEDFATIIHHHWVFDSSVFPTERHRVQFAFIMLFMAYTGSRPGALLEGNDDPEEFQGVLYRDFKLVLLRDPENPSLNKLVLHATLRHMKGREHQKKPTSYMFYERHDSLAFCPITLFLALAFADEAFEAKINTPAELFSKSVPEGLEGLTVHWKPTIEDTPVFRRAERSKGYYRTSPTKMLTQASHNADIKRLGLVAGFPEKLVAYCLRRGVANAVDAVATDAQRNQVLGHGSSGNKTYQQHYQDKHVAVDVQAVYSGHPSNVLLRRAAGRMGLHRDSRAPSQLSDEDLKAIKSNDEILKLCYSCESIKKDIIEFHGAIGQAKGTSLHTQYIKAQNALKAEVKRMKRDLLHTKRNTYFRSIGTIELDRQTSDSLDIVKPTPQAEVLPSYIFEERRILSSLLFESTDISAVTWPAIQQKRAQVISALTRLCFRQEVRTSSKKASYRESPDCCGDVSMTGTDDSEPGVTTEQEDLLSDYPLVLPGKVCLFCLGDEALAPCDRTKTYRRADVLRKHVKKVHLACFEEDEIIRCGHPACSETELDGIMRFKNHAARVHGSFL